MKAYIPFLMSKNNETLVSARMELASAVLYFELNKSESLKSLFNKQHREDVLWAARGFYPLKAVRFSYEDKSYCIYDAMGIYADVQLDCAVDFNQVVDIGDLRSLDAKERVDVLKKMANSIKTRDKVHIETGGLIQGFKGMADTLRGKTHDDLQDITVNLEGHGTGVDNDVSVIKDVLERIRKSIDREIVLVKELCGLDEENYRSCADERNGIFEEYRDRINLVDREISHSIADLIVERENKIRDIEKIYMDKKSSAVQEYISNRSKFDMAKISGNDIESEIYSRSMHSADDKAKQLAREESEEVKKVEKHYGVLLEEENRKLEQAVLEREKRLKECDEQYNKIHTAIDELKKALADDISLRRSQIDRIKGWFCKLECSNECQAIDIYIPFYIAEYTSGSRYRIFSPHMLEEKNQIMSLLSGITGRVPLPFSDREGFFGQLFEKLQDCIEVGGVDILELLSSQDLLKTGGVKQMVEDGLKELLNGGYISDKNHEKVMAGIGSMF